ncbi:MAG: DUF1214 domain-containing protein [Bacteroidota bacterium]
MIARMVLFVLIAVGGGLGSSWYMIEKGSALTTRSHGPWVMWTAAGRSDADPYTRAHFARRGVLPVTSTIALTYEAAKDNDGQPLYGNCDYAVEGEEPAAAWWSLSVYDDQGRLIPNPAERYSFNSATLMRGSGPRFLITLAPSARPGNWLPTGGTRRLTLVLNVEEPQAAGATLDVPELVKLPDIRKVACL